MAMERVILTHHSIPQSVISMEETAAKKHVIWIAPMDAALKALDMGLLVTTVSIQPWTNTLMKIFVLFRTVHVLVMADAMPTLKCTIRKHVIGMEATGKLLICNAGGVLILFDY